MDRDQCSNLLGHIQVWKAALWHVVAGQLVHYNNERNEILLYYTPCGITSTYYSSLVKFTTFRINGGDPCVWCGRAQLVFSSAYFARLLVSSSHTIRRSTVGKIENDCSSTQRPKILNNGLTYRQWSKQAILSVTTTETPYSLPWRKVFFSKHLTSCTLTAGKHNTVLWKINY